MKQLRNFVFTLNNPTDAEISELQLLGYSYLIIGHEKGKNGTPHLQGYCELTSRKSFGMIRKLIPRAHIENRFGTQDEAIEYCKKDGIFIEYGTRRAQGYRSDLAAVREHISSGGNLRSLFDKEEIKLNANTIRIAEKLFRFFETPRDYKPLVYWFHGKPGTGKTRAAREILPNAYFNANSTGKWWSGYDGHEDVIIDDVRAETIPFKNLLGITDRYPYQIEDKGYIRQLKASRIIITAPEPPFLVYFDTPEDKSQLTRRLDRVIDLKDYDETEWKNEVSVLALQMQEYTPEQNT